MEYMVTDHLDLAPFLYKIVGTACVLVKIYLEKLSNEYALQGIKVVKFKAS